MIIALRHWLSQEKFSRAIIGILPQRIVHCWGESKARDIFFVEKQIMIGSCLHLLTLPLTYRLFLFLLKVKRGKRKGGAAKTKTESKPAAALAPEETFYEGPPAITETIVPTISILTVVGIIPAAAAWARQAWVRYKITSRRVRVTSGINGKDMAEIVYPDIVEIRTVKRLFGDGDMVAFLRDGAKFEMRNIPDFEETLEFILKQVDADVAEQYREKGDVTLPPGGN